MYRKFTVLIYILLLTNVSYGAASEITGTWKCKFKSDIVDADQTLTIMEDGNYKLVANVFGSELTDLGTWSMQNNILTLNRLTHITRGKKEKSVHTSTHNVTTLNKESLIYTHGQGISTCTR